MLGQKLTKEAFAKSVSKLVPLLGAATSGALTLATFRSMSNRLKKQFSGLAHMTPQEYSKYVELIEITEDEIVEDAELISFEEVLSETGDTNYWACECNHENKGKFCEECGKQKPDALPQYRCDKCGWEPADMTLPPKFCPDCGDPFDSGDIIV